MSQGSMSHRKSMENGLKVKPPYSVETPYGFQIDLDFLKYVDDIEKGNTIKRVPIQRRNRGTKASTLPRNLGPSGYGQRPSPWGSTGALAPRSRLSDTHPHSYTCWSYDYRRPVSPTGPMSLAEMEARIREFDEQPLGEHIRPNLLRASSLPLTVLLRQESQSTDERSSLRSSRDRLGERNTSCEDVFYSPDSPRPLDGSGLLRRLTEALERVGELEMEVRVVPELRAQICILQEERERLRLGLLPYNPPSTMNGTTNPRSSSDFSSVDLKRHPQEHRVMFPRGSNIVQKDSNPTHEWKTSTDLDELLTVTSLQAKVALLEQKLHETTLELQRVVGLLTEQQQESRMKDEKMDHLIKNPGVWVRAERVMVEQNGNETVVRSMEPNGEKSSSFVCTRTVTTNFQTNQQDSVTSPAGSGKLAEDENISAVVHHIRKIKNLLDQQWECMCGETAEQGQILKHPDPKVNSLQREMMKLVKTLLSHYTEHDQHSEKSRLDSKSSPETDQCAQKSKHKHPDGADDGLKTTRGDTVSLDCKNQSYRDNLEQKESCSPGRTDASKVDADRPADLHRQMLAVGTEPGRSDEATASLEAETKTPKKQVGVCSGSEISREMETVSADFLSACQFLSDHMDNMDDPDEEMRKALVTLFQHWFGAAAEESSEASRVAAYLKEVKKATPSLLAFLINLADDNGNTVLHYSVSHCNYNIVCLLLDAGVSDVNVQNNSGYTAVMLASLTSPDGPGGMEVVRKLMEQGNVNIRSSQTGQTALHLAVRHGRVVMVRLLLSCKADANIQDNQGTTALMFASERGHTHIARLLLERTPCDLKLTDKRGRTALSIALQEAHTDTAALLQAHAKARAL